MTAASDVKPVNFALQGGGAHGAFAWGVLDQVLEHIVDIDALCRCDTPPRLHISATNVRTGKIKVFENADMSADVVLASACLPFRFQAVEIKGEFYWDGGFMGNPAIFPLIYKSTSKDVIIVHINPQRRESVPKSAAEIHDRLNEITFNSSLMREMRAIAFVSKLIDDGRLDGDNYKSMLIHSLIGDDDMADLSAASKMSPDWDFLCHLRDKGRTVAANWLNENFGNIGVRSSTDIVGTFL